MAPSVLTYSVCMPIELTRLCSGTCDYCPFPFTKRESLLSFRRLGTAVRQARLMGATLIDFVGGEDIADIPEIVHALRYYRLSTFFDYLFSAADVAQEPEEGQRPIPVRLDIGPVAAEDWSKLRSHFQGAKLLLTSVDPHVVTVGALEKAHTQRPEYRLQAIIDAGVAGMPLTTGTMIGIGESSAMREKALKVLAQIASKYGHLQSVLIQAFRPHSATPMAEHQPATVEEMLETVAMARRFLPPLVRIQINALDWRAHLPALIQAGAGDLGDLSLRILSGPGRDAEMELALLLDPLREAGHILRLRSFPGVYRGVVSAPVKTAQASGHRAHRPVHR